MKQYPKYKDGGIEWIGEVPEHWKIVKLKRATQFLYGVSLSNENRLDGKVPVYGSNGVTGYHNEAITKSPCIVIGRKGSFGKVNYSDKECFPIDTTFYIDTTATHNDLRWLYYLLLTVRLDSFSKDSAVPGLNREEAYERIITLSPFSEQQSIANYLDRKTRQIDTLIEKKQKLIDLLKEQRAAIINQAVTKGLNPNVKLKDSGIEWLGEIPEHWEVKKLKHVITIKSGEGITREDINEEGTYEVYGGNGFLGFTEDYNVTNDTLIIGRVGAKCGNVHLVCGHKWVTDNALIAKTNQNYRFLFFLLTSMRLNNLANQNAQPLITGTMIKYQIAALPSIDEQDKIVENIESETMRFDTVFRNNQRQIELLKEYRTALISEVVTGKIDVRDSGIQEVIHS